MDLMTPTVTWREAVQTDRAAMQAFTCTTPKPSYPQEHPKEWELQVQGWIRQLRVPIAGSFTQLGFIGSDLVAVAAFTCTVDQDGPEAFLRAAAISVAHRGSKDKRLADAMMDQVELTIARHFGALGHTSARLRGKIHESNLASQNMAKRAQWEPWLDVDEGLRDWVLRVEW